MRGRRGFKEAEIKLLIEYFQEQHDYRLLCLFVLGIRTGFRISELLSVRLGDVLRNGQVGDRLAVGRQNMKGKKESRTVPLHRQAKWAIEELIQHDMLPVSDQQYPLFPSQKGGPITTRHAWRLLKQACRAVGINDDLIGTHSMRKTFAANVFDRLDRDLLKTQKAMGHKKIDSTIRYLQVLDEDIDSAILDN